MTPLIAIGIIGGGLIAVKAFGHKETPAEEAGASDQGANTVPDVKANADAIGYDAIDDATYNAQGGVEAGQSHDVTNADGQHVGTVVGLEGGNQVFQEADGTVHQRTSGEPEIDPITVANVSRTVKPTGVIAGTVSKVATKVNPNPPKLTLVKPKRPVSSQLVDARIRSSARAGLRLPM